MSQHAQSTKGSSKYSLKSQKQVAQITSRERGELVTLCASYQLLVWHCHQYWCIPRKKYYAEFLNGSPEGLLGFGSPSGWMNSVLFAHVLQHFIETTRCSQENPVILTVDNMSQDVQSTQGHISKGHISKSHISVNALNLAKDHGINILTLPPHTSHKPQPLDRTIFGPLKVYSNSAAISWMIMNLGRHIPIREMGGFIGAAWMKAATHANIAQDSDHLKCGLLIETFFLVLILRPLCLLNNSDVFHG